MKTQLEAAREGIITPQIIRVAQDEGLPAELLRTRVAAGEIVILSHPKRPEQKAVGIGTGLRTKVNASIGTSSDICDLDLELRKARIAQVEGADTLMELSAAGDMDWMQFAGLCWGLCPCRSAQCRSIRPFARPPCGATIRDSSTRSSSLTLTQVVTNIAFSMP